MGSFFNIFNAPFLQFQNTMRTVLNAVSAVNAYEGFVAFLIPEDRTNNTFFPAMTTPYTETRDEYDPSSLSGFESIRWTDFGTWRILASSAHNDCEATAHASS